MLIPRFRNGSEKSINCSLKEVIVNAATAKSAFFENINKFRMNYLIQIRKIQYFID